MAGSLPIAPQLKGPTQIPSNLAAGLDGSGATTGAVAGGSSRLGATRGTGRETGFARGASTEAGGAGPGSDWKRSVCEKATDGAKTTQTIMIDRNREPSKPYPAPFSTRR